MNFPLQFSFKILAIASQIQVVDAGGSTLAYLKQKLLKLREDIDIYADSQQTQLLYNIKADRIIDFSARYTFTDGSGKVLGYIKRQGMRSLWKANYHIFDAAENHVMSINEENGWVKVWDSLFGEIPVIGVLSGYLFHPAYLVTDASGAQLARLEKQPAFFEGKFQLDKAAALKASDEVLVLLSVLMMTLLERARG
ncbi:MAG: hypothetical protein KIS88_02605 [Anaerolineales bacterium]|nr:hypothetical protein [Anaerolineales bacterium]